VFAFQVARHRMRNDIQQAEAAIRNASLLVHGVV
jgi:hypothetical protein